MGGSSGGGGSNSAPAPAPLDMNAIIAASTAAAQAQIEAQYDQLIENYPKLEELSFGTIQKLSDSLNNQATQDAQSYIKSALALGQMDPNIAEPTAIEQALYDAALKDLQLGRSLSPEQIRASDQATRAAFEARGLSTSMPSAVSEVLNRDAYATARERERQGFASAANDQYINNLANRRLSLANLYMTGANNLLATDPYARAVGPALGYSGSTQGNQMQQIGNTFASTNALAGNVASYNANMAASNYNSYLNTQAALSAANATNSAGLTSMFGSIGSGAISAAGTIGAASMSPFIFSDKRMKKNIKPLGKSGSVLGLKTYTYKYKGDDKKRIGVMAQDVQKVLPEAVEEVNYKGKKRLAIKPAVIGAALAEELAAQAA